MVTLRIFPNPKEADLKHESRKHESRKHESRKHASRMTTTTLATTTLATTTLATTTLAATTLAATALLGGLTLVGCGSKDKTKAADTPTHDAPNPAPMSNVTPATPDKKSDTAMQDLGAALKNKDPKAATQGAANLFDAEKQKAQEKLNGSAATRPTVPAMPQ